MPYQTGTITGTFHEPDGTPSRGHAYLSLEGTSLVKDDADNVVISGQLSAELDAQGVVTFTGLPATDDTALTPTGFGYRIQVRLLGSRRAFNVTTALTAGATVQLEDLIDAPEATFDPSFPYLTAADPVDGGTL